MKRMLILLTALLMPTLVFASSSGQLLNLRMTSQPIAIVTLILFIIAYLFVINFLCVKYFF